MTWTDIATAQFSFRCVEMETVEGMDTAFGIDRSGSILMVTGQHRNGIFFSFNVSCRSNHSRQCVDV